MTANGVNAELVATPSAGTVIKTGFGERTVAVQAETSSSAVAAQQTAMVQAAYIMAERRPRDFDQIRVKLMKTCKRPRFAEAARYLKPVGKEKDEDTGKWVEKIAEGLSIRFAEEAARNMGNLRIDSFTVYDDPRKKIVKFVTMDLESNTEWSKTVTIEKTVEKRFLKKGQQALATRLNSYGEQVFIVEATQEEMTKREGAEASKAWRDGILKNMPADIKEECLDEVRKTILNDASEDPEQKKKNMLDAFASIGVEPVHLREYVGHDLATLSPHEIVELRGLFSSIRDGETTWAAVIDQRRETTAEKERDAKKGEKPAATPPGDKPASVDAAVEAARKKREAATSGKPEVKPVAATTSTEKPAATGSGPKMATKEQARDLAYLCADKGVQLAEILERSGAASTAALTFDVAEAELVTLRALPDVGGDEPGTSG